LLLQSLVQPALLAAFLQPLLRIAVLHAVLHPVLHAMCPAGLWSVRAIASRGGPNVVCEMP
jgi:hypothetical protein